MAKTIKRGILTRNQWPKECQKSWACKGIFTGGCIKRGVGSSFRAKAHAHIRGTYKGWICVRKTERVSDRELMIHELAHLVTEQGHTDAFRREVIRLGGTIEPTDSLRSYEKRPRNVVEKE